MCTRGGLTRSSLCCKLSFFGIGVSPFYHPISASPAFSHGAWLCYPAKGRRGLLASGINPRHSDHQSCPPSTLVLSPKTSRNRSSTLSSLITSSSQESSGILPHFIARCTRYDTGL